MSDNLVSIFKCLADKSRLQIIKSLSKEDMYVERLGERLGLSAPTISFHLKKLEAVGIVSAYKDQYYAMYTLCRDTLKFNVLDSLLDDKDDNIENERDIVYRQSVLSNFFVYGKLKKIPSQSKKREIVLEEIANSFETGRKYTEREVNITIADFHDDFCTIRREMVGLGIFIRNDGIYEKMR